MDKTPCLCDNRDDIHCGPDRCDIAGPGEPGNPNSCRVCWLRLRDSHGPRRLPCVRLGAETGERVACPSCNGRVELKVFACAKHGSCTPAKPAPGVVCCVGCPDHHAPDPFGGEVVRNLAYHLYPASGNGVWQRNVARLLRRIRLFNGRRVVAIASDGGSDHPDVVKEAFAGHVHEFVVVPNDPGLREVATFEELLGRLETASPRAVTLYAHGKGVRRDPSHPTAHAWADALYEVCLDYWPWAERLLRSYPVAGAFLRRIKPWAESSSEWHFSGSWAWFRNRDLFGKPDWRRIDRFWSGIEGWLSLHFKYEEAGSLFHAFHRPGPGLYDHAYFNQAVLPDLARWREEHRADRKEW